MLVQTENLVEFNSSMEQAREISIAASYKCLIRL